MVRELTQLISCSLNQTVDPGQVVGSTFDVCLLYMHVPVKAAPSMSDAAMGKLSLGAKALSEGGFEKLYKQTFSSSPDEHLKKTFACYLSTATGPVAGTLYLTNLNVAFCSDRPLSFAAPSGQTAWSYYKVWYGSVSHAWARTSSSK